MKREPFKSLDALGDEQILTTADVASILQKSGHWVATMLSEGRIAGAIRAGRSLRITAGDLRAWRDSEKIAQREMLAEFRAQLRELR